MPDKESLMNNTLNMDTAVNLVQAYLHLNGYITACELPVLEVRRERSNIILLVGPFRYNAFLPVHLFGGSPRGRYLL